MWISSAHYESMVKEIERLRNAIETLTSDYKAELQMHRDREMALVDKVLQRNGLKPLLPATDPAPMPYQGAITALEEARREDRRREWQEFYNAEGGALSPQQIREMDAFVDAQASRDFSAIDTWPR